VAVARRSTVSSSFASGSGNASWPAGAAAGDLVVVNVMGAADRRAEMTAPGWAVMAPTPSTRSYWRVVTAADVAGTLPCVRTYVAFVTAYTGAGRVGAVADLGNQNPGCTTTSPNSVVLIFGRGSAALTPAGGKILGHVTNSGYSNRRNALWEVAATTVGWYGLTNFNGTDSDSFEIVASEAPAAPQVTAPASGSTVSASAALALAWLHRSTRGGTQEAYKVRLVKDGATTYYLTSGGTLTTSDTAVTSATMAATVAAGQLVSGSSYVLTVQTLEASMWSAWSDPVTLSAITPPTVSTITVSSPAGSLTPSVSWTESVTGGQVAYQVRICLATDATSDTPLWDSQVTAGASLSDTAPALATWPNGTNLKAWVRVQQPGLWSEWTADDAAFTVSWTAPAAPSSVSAANQAVGPIQVTVAGVVAPMLPMTNVVPNGDFDAPLTGWEGLATISITSGQLSVARGAGAGPVPAIAYRRLTAASGHVFYAAATITDGTASTGFRAGHVWDGAIAYPASAAATRLSHRWTAGASDETVAFVDNREVGQPAFFGDKVLAIDLTATYGAGSEPTKATMDTLLSTWSTSWFDGTYDPTVEHEVQVQSSTDSGATWTDVASKVPTGTTEVVDVPSARYGVGTLFRARARSPFLGVPLWSGWTTAAAAVASTDRACYLIGDDNTWIAARVRTDADAQPAQEFVTHYGLGAAGARVDRGPHQGWAGTTTVLTDTKAARDDLLDWLELHPEWVWRWPPERDGSTYADAGLSAVALRDGVELRRLVQAAISHRDLPIPWVTT